MTQKVQFRMCRLISFRCARSLRRDLVYDLVHGWAAFIPIGFRFFMLHNALQNQATELVPTLLSRPSIGSGPFRGRTRTQQCNHGSRVPAATIMVAGLVAAHLLKRAAQQTTRERS